MVHKKLSYSGDKFIKSLEVTEQRKVFVMGKRGRKPNKGKSSQASTESVSMAESATQNAKEMPGPDNKQITDYFPTSPKPKPLIHKEEPIQIPGVLTPETTPTKNSPKTTANDSHNTAESSPATTNEASVRTEQPKTTQSNESPTESPEHKRSLPNNVSTVAVGKDNDRDKGGSGDKRSGKSDEKTSEAEKVVKGKEKGQRLDDKDVTAKGKTSKSKGSGKNRKSRSARQQPSVQTNTLTDYFPVRRSNRRCKSDIEAEQKKEIEEAVLSVRETGMEVQDILGKGRGVVATKAFRQGDFVVEYYGDLIDIKEAKEREADYGKDSSIGCYMYYFQFKNKQYCVDATLESGRLGRLLNHSKNGNCCTKLVEVKGQPHLIIVAAKDIAEGEEMLYDYGDRDKDTLQAHPWLAL